MKDCRRIKKSLLPVIMILFLIVSTLVLIPQKDQKKPYKRAATLEKKVTREGNIERTDFLDESGKVVIADDLGYATIIISRSNTHRYEHFYDEKGEPVSRYPGYYALFMEYNEEGYVYHITYLDRNDIPVITKEGYSDKYLTYYDSGKIKTEKYYDISGNPVFTSDYGHGFLNEYNEKGQNYKTTYLDIKGNPAVVGLGYAIILRNFYETKGLENGKVESEFYFDEKEKPKELSLGQFGIHKEYDGNGQIRLITYLDANGKPIATEKGYTTIVRSYYSNNRMATEQYYDIDGNPISLGEGQYGIKQKDEQLSYLDQNGNETFNLKRLLYNKTWIIIPGTLFIIIMSTLFNRKQNVVLFFLYIAVVIYLTLLYRENVSGQIGGLLWQYRRMFTDNDARIEIIRNIWLFIPLGAILRRICPTWKILLITIALSITIEAIQFFSSIGFCEVDDLLSNSFGGYIGYKMGKWLLERKNNFGSSSIKRMVERK